MGKNIISQARGKGSLTYRAPSHRYWGRAELPKLTKERVTGRIIDLVKCPGHDVPLMIVKYSDGETILMMAPEGVYVHQEIFQNPEQAHVGDVLSLKDIVEGTLVFNLEAQAGDGGKFARGCGGFARIASKQAGKVLVEMPSKKTREFDEKCRAIVGIASAGGKTEKPLMKAGNAYHKMVARNKLYPLVSGQSMNAVDHPFGTSRSSKKGRPTCARRNAPPGANVGKIGARRTGRKR